MKYGFAPSVLALVIFVLTAGYFVDRANASECGVPPPGIVHSNNKLNVAHAFEAAGRFADAENAYRAAMEAGIPEIRGEAVEALLRITRLRAESLLALGMSLEACDRLDDAANAYLEMLKAGDQASRAPALNGLTRLSSRKEAGSAATMLEAADILKAADRLEDSEALYRLVIQSGTDAQRQVALKSFEEVVSTRASIMEERIFPVWDGALKVVIPVLFLIILVWPLGAGVQWYARIRQRSRLSIEGFDAKEGDRTAGATFGKTLSVMHERVSMHFRQKTVVGVAGKMPVLLGSDATNVVTLITETNESLVPFVKWFSRITHQPAYQISGFTEVTTRNIKVYAKLEHSGQIIRQWAEDYPLSQWFASEQDLAYNILISLKKHANES